MAAVEAELLGEVVLGAVVFGAVVVGAGVVVVTSSIRSARIAPGNESVASEYMFMKHPLA